MIRILSDSVSTSVYDDLYKNNIDVVSLTVHYDGKDQLDTEMDFDYFNDTLAERGDNLPTSSQPSIASYENYFESAAKAGDSVVGVFLSSKLSSSFEGAIMAARRIKKEYCDFQCRLIDSCASCGPQMAALLAACGVRDNGGTLDEIADAAEHSVRCSRIMFTPSDLRFLVLGGRLNAVTAKIASKLKIFPIITTVDGYAVASVKVRTKSKANDKMFNIFVDDVKAHGLKYVVVHYAGKKTKELFDFKERVEEFVKHEVELVSVSPVISVHSGPAIGIAYECNDELSGKFTGGSPQILFSI
ncbi:MAG: DegV family protein [Phoenicibacter congonensis]|uniref:DegV family protein n=1 Tax=Phoenicibacter congonensis TaxID=1944646 RepID=A0AA43RHY5_9ACTN|nr:DegV family protein [Phoenicibacter congonensis]